MLNLVSVLENSTREHPEKTAIVFGENRFTFGQVNAMANQIANGLDKAGIQKGDKVALSCPNLPYFPLVYYAILKTGALVVPINVLLKGREIAYHLNDSNAKAYFCFQGTQDLPMGEEGFKGFKDAPDCNFFYIITPDPAAESPIESVATLGQMMKGLSDEFETIQTEPQDSAVILYTSGTTGFPKGAELSHSNMVMNAQQARDYMLLEKNDIHIVALPLFHSFGQTVQMNAGFQNGNTLVLIPRFEAEAVLCTMQKENVTLFCGVPTMWWGLLNHEDKEKKLDTEKIAANLRIGVSGGASMPVEIIKGLQEKYNIPIVEGYGLSETSPVVTFNHVYKERKPGSIGSAIWGMEVKVFDKNNQEVLSGEVGELVIRGHSVMKGYYNKPEATAEAFDGTSWFHSGDLARMDEDGYVYIVDRVKDMVIRGGFNVYPREIEEVLITHEAVSMASVIGVPHDSHGEEIKAFVILKPGADLTPNDLIEWSKENMAAYKYPRIIEITESLPMTATGKILKNKLRQ